MANRELLYRAPTPLETRRFPFGLLDAISLNLLLVCESGVLVPTKLSQFLDLRDENKSLYSE